jgi:V/A-type H+-transporting ATPase subunit C
VVFEEVLNPSSPLFWLTILIILGVVSTFIARSFKTYVKFIYPNAKFEAIGNPFIQERELTALIDTPSLEVLKDRLNTLRDYQVDGQTAAAIQQSLDQNFLRTLSMMQQDSTKNLHAFYDLYLQKMDFYLIKNEVKRILQGNKNTLSPESALTPQTQQILEQMQNASKENVSELLSSLGFNEEVRAEVSKEQPDLQVLDVLFDKQYVDTLMDLRVPHKCEQAYYDFIKNMIDMLTIKHLLRAKQLVLPPDRCKTFYLGEGKQIARWRFEQIAEASDVLEAVTALEGTSYFPALSAKLEQYKKEKSVQVFESSVDSAFLARVKEISLHNYLTMGPSLRFLVSKEFEIKNLKVIVKGIAEHISAEIIKNNLVKEVAG